MSTRHMLLILLVIVVWGVNFIFVSMALTEMPPFMLCSLRFILSSIPLIFFVPFPKGSFMSVTAYGLVMFGIQFSLLFMALNIGMPAGLSSLLMQTQVFFSMFFAAIFLDEQPQITQVFGAGIAFSGIALVASHLDAEITLSGFALILLAAANWGLGNLITKKIKTTQFISVIVWGCFVTILPMMLMSFLFEGPALILSSWSELTWKGLGSLLYIVYASTLIGYVAWNFLISKYPVSMVVPFTLLIPVVGMMSSVFFLGEPLQPWKLMTALLVMTGLSINVLGGKILAYRARMKDPLLQ